LRIPDLLGAQTKSAEQLAAETGADPDRLSRLLVLAVGLGLFARRGQRLFANNAMSTLLRRDHPQSLHTEACHALSRWTRIAWDNLDQAVRHGTSGFELATGIGVFDYLTDHPDESADFHAFQAHVTRRNVAALLARHEFPPNATIVDIGGGSGTLLSQVLRHQPGLRGVLFDRPEVMAVARTALADDIRDRIELVGGDFFAEIPAAADCYVLSHILHDWPDDAALAILRQVTHAMTTRSTLLILENIKDSEDNLFVAYLDVLMLTAWGGRERSLKDLNQLCWRAGLDPIAHEVLDPRSCLTALTACRPDPAEPPRADVR
jgi:hypothetical protein